MRRRYPLALLLVLAAAMVLTAAFASSALALPTFDTAVSGVGPCNSCHSMGVIHGMTTHSETSCSTCHVNTTANPPTPAACTSCHGTTSIMARAAHITEGCTTTPGCHGASLPAPTITSFTPTSGPVGTTVTVTGTNFTGVTAVKFNGVAATTFAATGATKITAKVPTGATTGTIEVTTPGGSVTSATPFTVLIKESIGLKLNGKTTTVAILLGRSVKATGVITPTLTVPQAVKLTVQKWRPATRRWAAVTTLSTIKVTGAYSKTYKPASRGTFRMRAVLAKTDVHTAATSVWRKFIVK